MSLDDLLTPRLVELGQLRIGTKGAERKSKKGGTYRAPEKLDHFIITTSFRGDDGMLTQDTKLMEALKADHADDDGQLREVPITVLSNQVEDFLHCHYAHYRTRNCFARCDGKEIVWFFNPKTGEKLEEPKRQEWDEKFLAWTFADAPYWKKHTIFSFVIASNQARWGGVYKFRTTSVISANQLYGSLIHLKGLTGGVLMGMPLRLVVRPVQVAPNGKKTTVHVVHVELRGPDLHELQSKAFELASFQEKNKVQLARVRRELLMLQRAPGDESELEQVDVAEEFHPDPEIAEQERNASRIEIDFKVARTVERIDEIAGRIDGFDEETTARLRQAEQAARERVVKPD